MGKLSENHLKNDLIFFDNFENLFISIFTILNYFRIGTMRREQTNKHWK